MGSSACKSMVMALPIVIVTSSVNSMIAQELFQPVADIASVFTGGLRAHVAVCCILFMLGRIKMSFQESFRVQFEHNHSRG